MRDSNKGDWKDLLQSRGQKAGLRGRYETGDTGKTGVWNLEDDSLSSNEPQNCENNLPSAR